MLKTSQASCTEQIKPFGVYERHAGTRRQEQDDCCGLCTTAVEWKAGTACYESVKKQKPQTAREEAHVQMETMTYDKQNRWKTTRHSDQTRWLLRVTQTLVRCPLGFLHLLG